MVSPHPTADPEQLEREARRLRTEADTLERAVAAYDRAASAARWEGRAAVQFKADADTDNLSAQGLAEELRRAAAAMEAGADEIRRYLAEIERQRRQEQELRRRQVVPGPR